MGVPPSFSFHAYHRDITTPSSDQTDAPVSAGKAIHTKGCECMLFIHTIVFHRRPTRSMERHQSWQDCKGEPNPVDDFDVMCACEVKKHGRLFLCFPVSSAWSSAASPDEVEGQQHQEHQEHQEAHARGERRGRDHLQEETRAEDGPARYKRPPEAIVSGKFRCRGCSRCCHPTRRSSFGGPCATGRVVLLSGIERHTAAALTFSGM